MISNFPWHLVGIEISLIFLSLGCLILDLFLKNNERRGDILCNTTLSGIAVLFIFQCTQWGNFGSAFKNTFVQDGVSFFFKILFFLAAFVVVFMAKSYKNQ